jgi:L,D-transpeptidase YcbB
VSQANFIFFRWFRIYGFLCLCFFSGFALATVKDNPYQRLEKKHALYLAAMQQPWPILQNTQPLFLGVHNPSVAFLRQRLCATYDLPLITCRVSPPSIVYDKTLETGVKFFQKRHGLIPDGVVDEITRQALNVSPEKRLHQIQINLKRWSRLLALVEPDYIWINVPDHYLRLVKNHHVILTSRIIVGKLSRPTPEINSKVTRIFLNPYWTVPPRILRCDVLPKALQNKNYLQQNRMRVYAAKRPNEELDPTEIDWFAVKQNPTAYIFRQDPGPHNALGQIKFEFSNAHMIYLHDTPAKHLFNAERRLFSSGCVRMEDPFTLLDALAELDPSLQQYETQIEEILASGRVVTIHLKQAIPIHLTYITAWVDHIGVLHFWDDVYARDPEFYK